MTPNPQDPGDRAAARPAGWAAFAVKAAVFLAIALLGTEALWRGLRYLPAKSDLRHFAKLRRDADLDSRSVALLGSSRVQYGLNPHSLERTVPGRRYLQLSIPGHSPLPVLEDLARDPNFKARVICELNPAHWGGGSPFPNFASHLDYTHPEVSGAYLESLLAEQFRDRFSFFSYNLFTELPRIVQHKYIPQPEPPDRFVPFSRDDPVLNERWIRRAESDAEVAARLVERTGSWRIKQEVQGWVARIRRRGGDVAFVRLPVEGRLRVREESVFPQTQSLIREVRAWGVVVIDFAEMPGSFRCPDGSHLEASEADRFSRLVGEALAAQGFLR
jgi:hypothetical protein